MEWQGAVLLDEYADVQEIRRQIQHIGHMRGTEFDLRYAKGRDEWIVLQIERGPNGEIRKKRFVGAYPELDQRIVDRLMQITHPSYSLVEELDRADDKRERDIRSGVRESAGLAAQEMSPAVRRLHQIKDRIFVP